MHSWLDYLVIAIILLGFGVVLYKGGAANPVGTGRLQRRVQQLAADVSSQGDKIEALETQVNVRVSGIEVQLRELSDRMALKADIDAVRRELAADKAISERTWHAVDRLQNYFIAFGVGRKEN